MRAPRLIVLGLMLLLGCSTSQHQSQPLFGVSAALQTGEETAARMTRRYSETPSHCADLEEMAFKCSGVIFRGTEASPAFHAWNPAPNAYLRNGVSFSYLRADSKFKRLAYNYNHGFVLYPQNDQPADTVTIEVRCVFPLDAASELRATDACGSNPNFPQVSAPCQPQGVLTGEQWLQHFINKAQSRGTSQCGFKVHEAMGMAAAQGFYEAVRAMGLAGNLSFPVQNELILTPWAQDIGDRLPIEAFFYTPEGDGGLAGAREDQEDFYKGTGILLPVIRMTLPATADANATFQFFSGEQWTPEK
ncbi:hypothetical protein SRABI06_05442 [Pseudomonas brassicacearum]|nr:hypothetical protein SRABI06_05442 [Pseudomonas brassicacearum]